MKLFRKIAIAAIAAASLAGSALADGWEPQKPIKIVVGFSAGGGTDVVARALVAASQEFFPVPLVVVNMPGAGGTLAADFVAKQPADGYTLLVAGGSESVSVPNFRDVSYSLDSFRPILRAHRSRTLVISKAGSGLDSLEDVKAAAENGDVLVYGSSGVGSLAHATMLLLADSLDVPMEHVPFSGGAEQMAALLGGHIQLSTAAPEEAKAQVDANTISLLAITSDERSPDFPDVPTLVELGYPLVIENQKGLVAPAGLPDDIYEYLSSHFEMGMETEVWASMAGKLGLESAFLDGPAFSASMHNVSDAIGSTLEKLQ